MRFSSALCVLTSANSRLRLAEYPHWQMRPELKFYYLFQAAYWLQQALVMLLRLEAPRKDYYELIAHVRSIHTELDASLVK